MINLINDDCIKAMKQLDADSVDSLVTDPPAGISFMGKEWDSDKGGRDGWIVWMTEVMQECLRVMKPGAHGLVWAIPRTSHWTATALENAGFEVRDVVTHLFGSGFPKSLDISKAIDKAAGVEREVIGQKPGDPTRFKKYKEQDGCERSTFGNSITAPSSDSAKQWAGWGTALKPASEHWILVRKPLSEKTVASNVLKHGTGGINIDASRIASDSIYTPSAQGRFPANLVFSHSDHCTDEQCDIECAILKLDEQSGELVKSTFGNSTAVKKNNYGIKSEVGKGKPCGFGDTGGASRFFYCAKISTSERNAGLDGMPTKKVAISNGGRAAIARGEEYIPDSSGFDKIRETKNTHPTVKPKKLMSYFIKMITPPNGTVLDPFMGSGSTGIAAKESGFKFIGIEQEPDYFEIAKKRINGS